MQVFGLQGDLYRAARLASRADLSNDEKRRLDAVRRFERAMGKGLSSIEAARVVGVPKSTLYRWLRRATQTGRVHFESRRPKRFRRGADRSKLRVAVLSLRRENPTWGKRKIAKKLACFPGANVGSVGRILSGLIKRGTIRAATHATRLAGQKRRRKRPYAHKLRRGCRLHASTPGQAVQVDHMTVEISPGHYVKHFNGVCVASRWNVADVYSTASANTAKCYLDKLIMQAPFKVSRIQVDGGSEFMAEFEEACREKGIELYVLAPKSPKLNGRVERINGTWRADFYEQYTLSHRLHELRPDLQDFQDHYNYERPHDGINLSTPWHVVESFNTEKKTSAQSHMW